MARDDSAYYDLRGVDWSEVDRSLDEALAEDPEGDNATDGDGYELAEDGYMAGMYGNPPMAGSAGMSGMYGTSRPADAPRVNAPSAGVRTGDPQMSPTAESMARLRVERAAEIAEELKQYQMARDQASTRSDALQAMAEELAEADGADLWDLARNEPERAQRYYVRAARMTGYNG